MGAPPAYTVHAADVDRDREAILGLWHGNLGEDARMAAKYDWFYRQCPYGAPLTLLLRHEASGQWVGVASAGERRMLLDGKPIRAGVLVDLAVLPEHRSLGPAMLLQMALVEAGSKRFDLLYGFPNEKAVPVFRRVGHVALGRIARHARVLRHARYLQRRVPAFVAIPAGAVLDALDRGRLAMRTAGHACEWRDRGADEAVDEIWQASDHGRAAIAIRDRAFLQWRFDASPLVDARHLLVRDASGVATAWFACEAREHGLHVADFWTRRGVAGPDAAQLAVLLRAARAAGHGSVTVELGTGSASDAWRDAGFVARESRPVFGRTSPAADMAPTPGLWLTSADEDE